ncbi:MAG: LPS-assembly protein LptD [Flavobacteriales bacterium]|nr:LPS-assembly protein LptD [Flavobacteriales bacterium]
MLMCVASGLHAQKLEEEVRYQARDSIRYDLDGQTVYLFGAASVHYQDIQLSADRIAFNFKNEEAQAFGALDSTGKIGGKPSFTQGGHTIDADSIRYSFRTNQGLIREVRTQEQEAWVHASLSKRLANGEVHSLGGKLTTCDRPNPHYHFQVGRMMVIPDDKIITGPAYLKVRKVPLPLAVPFGFFPNKKGGSSGVLIPVWGVNQSLGYYLLNGGWYQPLGEKVDLQLTGDIYSRGSWALKGYARYRSRYRYNGGLQVSHSTLLNSDPEFPDFSRTRNFFINWNHTVDPRASLTDRFSASVNVGTSRNYTNNFNSSVSDYLSNTFQSNIAWTHLWPGKPYTLSVNALHRQNTINRTFDITLPAITFNVQRILPIQMLRPAGSASRWYDQLAVNWTTNFDNRLSTTEEHLYLENVPALAGQARNGLRHTAALTTTLKNRFFSVNPEFRFTDRMYFDQLRKRVISDTDTMYTITDTIQKFAAPPEYSMGVTFTSKLYGMYSFRGNGLKAIRHTITPTAGLSYRPDNSTRIEGPFGVNGALSTYSPYQIGIYGEPSTGESGSLNLGLIQNVEAKVRDRKAPADSTGRSEEITYKKIKLIDFLGINTSYDLLKDSVQWSPISIAARTALFNTININLNSTWDPYAVDGLGQRIDRSERSVSGALARMLYTNVAAGFDLKSKRYGQTPKANTNDQEVVQDSDPGKGARVNFSLPWRLGVNYSYDLSRAYSGGTSTDTERQSVLFNGDVTVMKYWKLGWSSGYDIVAKEFTPTSLNLYWDLHCWEFNFNIIPIGVRKSFMFRINVKASLLRDMKFEQRRPYGNQNNLLY